MKLRKLIAMTLAAAILAVSLCISVPAAGTLILKDDFEIGFPTRNWITDRNICNFEWDKYNKCIQGYNAATVLQSNYDPKYGKCWDKFYASMDVQIRAFDDYLPEHEGRSHYVGMWYQDLFQNEDGEKGGEYYYEIEIETGKATLTKTFDYTADDGSSETFEAVIAEGQIPGQIEVGEDSAWFDIGLRVTDGKIECYYNEQFVLSSSAEDAGEEYINGMSTNAVDTTVGSQKSALLFWNTGNWIAFDNFEVWTPDYDFVVPEDSYSYLKLAGGENGYLYYDLIFHDRAELGVSSVGFELDYSDSMTLVSCDQEFGKGTFVTSENEAVKPYMILWVWGTDVLPSEETVIARLTFKVDPDIRLEDEVKVTLSYEKDNPPAGLDGKQYENNVNIEPEVSGKYSDILEQFPEVDTRASIGFDIVRQHGNELELILCLESKEDSDISTMDLSVVYPEGITLKETEELCLAAYEYNDNNDNIEERSYSVRMDLENGISAGKTALISCKFEIDDSVSATDISLITVAVNGVTDGDSKDITHRFTAKNYEFDPATAVKYMGVTQNPERVKRILSDDTLEFVDGTVAFHYWNGDVSEDIPLSECTFIEYVEVMWDYVEGDEVIRSSEYQITVEYDGYRTTFSVWSIYSPGDLNNDKAVNLSDVTLLLKSIARWDVSYNHFAADANDDGQTNLADATLMLQYIAKWNVVLG